MDVKGSEIVDRRVELGGAEKEVLSVPVKRYADLHPLAKMIDSWGNYGDLELSTWTCAWTSDISSKRGSFLWG